MSYETRRPNIRLVISDDWFNILISALKENINVNSKFYPESTTKAANTLLDKLMKHSRPYFEEESQTAYVDIRFFPNEASNMIWQLLLVCGSYIFIDFENYYAQLKEKQGSE